MIENIVSNFEKLFGVMARRADVTRMAVFTECPSCHYVYEEEEVEFTVDDAGTSGGELSLRWFQGHFTCKCGKEIEYGDSE